MKFDKTTLWQTTFKVTLVTRLPLATVENADRYVCKLKRMAVSHINLVPYRAVKHPKQILLFCRGTQTNLHMEKHHACITESGKKFVRSIRMTAVWSESICAKGINLSLKKEYEGGVHGIMGIVDLKFSYV